MNMGSLSRVLTETSYNVEGAASPGPIMPPQILSLHHLRVPEFFEERQCRTRNLSGASNTSESSVEELQPLTVGSEGVTLHPRVRRLSADKRRSSVATPHSINFLQPSYLVDQQPWNRSFSEPAQESQEGSPVSMISSPVGSEVFSSDNSPLLPGPGHISYDVVDNFPGSVPGAVGGISPVQRFQENGDESNEENVVPNERIGSHNEKHMNEEWDELQPTRFKRQLSIPSTTQTLTNINEVKKFLQVHDSEPQLLSKLERVESFVNKKKNEGKRRKLDGRFTSNSQE